MIRYADVNIGDELTVFTTPPITRTMLALYAGASGDHNPMHIDLDFARQAGLDDVFAHGMLVMAQMGRALTNWAPQTALRQFGVRFVAITHVHDVLTCGGKIVEKFEADGEQRVRLELSVTDQTGERKLTGEAVVALS
jgi:acyl dehydratase